MALPRAFRGTFIRILQLLTRFGPGSNSFRAALHRLRGVEIGERVRIATDVILETAHPEWISIGSDVQIGVRTTVLAHIHALKPQFESDEQRQRYRSVVIEDEVNIGPGCLVLPNVKIGRGAVIAAGSVVSTVVPAMTMVRGNPAVPVARCGVPLAGDTTMKEFMRNLTPVRE